MMGKGFADEEMLELPVVTYSEKVLTSRKQFENGESLEDGCRGCIILDGIELFWLKYPQIQ